MSNYVKQVYVVRKRTVLLFILHLDKKVPESGQNPGLGPKPGLGPEIQEIADFLKNLEKIEKSRKMALLAGFPGFWPKK